MQKKGVIITVISLAVVAGLAYTLVAHAPPSVTTSQSKRDSTEVTNAAPVGPAAATAAPVTPPAADAAIPASPAAVAGAAAVATSASTTAATALSTDPNAPAASTTPPAATPDATAAAATPAPDAAKNADGNLLAAPASMQIDVDKAMADHVIGNENAPVTIIEYASLTCPHCAHFENEIFPEVKKQLIDTGKVKFIFRDFPLDGFAMKAAMMARCAAPDKYFDLIELFFHDQERWIKSTDPLKSLTQLAGLSGMSDDYINACINNQPLEDALIKGIKDAQGKYNVNATPTFVFNDGKEQLSGAQPIEKFNEIVNKLSGK